MSQKSLVMVSPHNWYDHVLPGKVNRPLKIVEQYYNRNFFNNTLIVNRVHPKRLFRKQSLGRKVVLKRLFYKVYLDQENEVFYLEHCLPFGKLELFLLPRIIQEVTRFLNFKELIMKISDPKSTYLFPKVKGVGIFDAYDDWSLSPLFSSKKRHMTYINIGYENARKHADVIITNTEHMKRKMQNSKKNVHVLCNASSLEKNESVTSENKEMQKIVGYIGNIHERIDLNILEKLLKTHTDVQFWFVGKNELKSEKFKEMQIEYPNLKLLGPIPYEEVPVYIQKFDVCIVPHVVNDYTLSQDSMKIYDYLTFGKPVVSTKIPPTDRLSKYIYTSTLYDFVDNVELALKENDKKLSEERVNLMKNNDWKHVAEKIFTMIQEV